jgi:aspartate ammonia-lyase
MSQGEVHARLVTDPLGDVSVPAVALYGVQTQRALDNFRQADRERCAMYAECTVGLAALHNQELGFMGAAKLAQRAIASGKSVQEVLGEADR